MSLKNLKIVGFVGVLVVVMLSVNDFFASGSSTVFNEVLTPVATVAAAIIYYRTLLEMKKSTEIAVSNRNYEIFKDDINRVYNKYKEMRFFSLSHFDEDIESLVNTSNVIEFRWLLTELVFSVKNSSKFDPNMPYSYNNKRSNSDQNDERLKFSVEILGRIAGNYSSLESIIKEILSSNLDKSQKRNLIDKIKGDILVDYLAMFVFYGKNTASGHEFSYLGLEFALVNPKNENEVIPSFSFMGFDNVYKLLKANNYLTVN